MAEAVFWDTVAFVALANRDDSLHSQAVQVSKHLAQRHAHILTTRSVLTEVINTLRGEEYSLRPFIRYKNK